MNLTIPDELLEKKHISSQKIKQDIAIFLLDKCSLTLEQATQIAEMPLNEFKQLAEPKKSSKLSHLKNRHCVIGNSDDLVNLDWGDEWKILN